MNHPRSQGITRLVSARVRKNVRRLVTGIVSGSLILTPLAGAAHAAEIDNLGLEPYSASPYAPEYATPSQARLGEQQESLPYITIESSDIGRWLGGNFLAPRAGMSVEATWIASPSSWENGPFEWFIDNLEGEPFSMSWNPTLDAEWGGRDIYVRVTLNQTQMALPDYAPTTFVVGPVTIEHPQPLDFSAAFHAPSVPDGIPVAGEDVQVQVRLYSHAWSSQTSVTWWVDGERQPQQSTNLTLLPEWAGLPLEAEVTVNSAGFLATTTTVGPVTIAHPQPFETFTATIGGSGGLGPVAGFSASISVTTLPALSWNNPALITWIVDGERQPGTSTSTVAGVSTNSIDLRPEWVNLPLEAEVTISAPGRVTTTQTFGPVIINPPTPLPITSVSIVGDGPNGEVLDGGTARVDVVVDHPLLANISVVSNVVWLVDGEPIGGITWNSLNLAGGQVGSHLSAIVTLSTSGFETLTGFKVEAVEILAPMNLDVSGVTISIAGATAGLSALVEQAGTALPSGSSSSTQWFVNGEPSNPTWLTQGSFIPLDWAGQSVQVVRTFTRVGFAPAEVRSEEVTIAAAPDLSTLALSLTGLVNGVAPFGAVVGISAELDGTSLNTPYTVQWFVGGSQISSTTFQANPRVLATGGVGMAGETLQAQVTFGLLPPQSTATFSIDNPTNSLHSASNNVSFLVNGVPVTRAPLGTELTFVLPEITDTDGNVIEPDEVFVRHMTWRSPGGTLFGPSLPNQWRFAGPGLVWPNHNFNAPGSGEWASIILTATRVGYSPISFGFPVWDLPIAAAGADYRDFIVAPTEPPVDPTEPPAVVEPARDFGVWERNGGAVADIPAPLEFFTGLSLAGEEVPAEGFTVAAVNDGETRLVLNHNYLRELARETDHVFTAQFSDGWPEVTLTLRTAAGFSDVPHTATFHEHMHWMLTNGLADGWVTRDADDNVIDRQYRPGNGLLRNAMAAFLFRISGEVDTFVAPETATFSDVPVGAPFFREIEWMAARGISTGWIIRDADGNELHREFRPGGDLTRESAATFLFRLAGATHTLTGTMFADITLQGNVHAPAVEWMAAQGIATGNPQPEGLPNFNPGGLLNRGAMAAFIYRAVNEAQVITLN